VRRGWWWSVDQSEATKGADQIQISPPCPNTGSPAMQRLPLRLSRLRIARLPLARTTADHETSILLLLRHSSDLSRARHMRSPPSPSTSTEPPSRIPKDFDTTQPNIVVEEATTANVTATETEGGPGSQSGKEEVLFERSPSWWIKWVWVIIGMDVIWS
jgi:hypothetical protein